MKMLQAEGIACAAIDLTSLGSRQLTSEQWYAGIVRSLVHSFELSSKVTLRSWWRDRDLLSPVQRLNEFIEEVLLAEILQNIVIFFDEIDSILNLNFASDDFFALIRSCYNQRVDNLEYRRLTFALLGVAAPSDLIADKSRTPFNIGQGIELSGFQLVEALPLVQGLAQKAENDQEVLKEILAWTGGQPFLTQKLCKLVLASPFAITSGNEVELIEQVVRSQIIENWEAQDEPEHLRTIRDRLLRNEVFAGRLLGLYQEILQLGYVSSHDSSEQIELQLSGLVVKQQGKLKIYNRIYESVFNQIWVDNALAELRPHAEAIAAWLASNYQDESKLLRGQELQNALAWAQDKSLSDQDYKFLSKSQELARRDVEMKLDRQQNSRKLHYSNKTRTLCSLMISVLLIILIGLFSAQSIIFESFFIKVFSSQFSNSNSSILTMPSLQLISFIAAGSLPVTVMLEDSNILDKNFLQLKIPFLYQAFSAIWIVFILNFLLTFAAVFSNTTSTYSSVQSLVSLMIAATFSISYLYLSKSLIATAKMIMSTWRNFQVVEDSWRNDKSS
jgi:hypothetical protein